MRQIGVRLQLLLAALIVLLATAAADHSHYFCKMMGRAVAECCCATSHQLQRSRSASARAPDCCELLTASKQSVATSHSAALPDVPVAAWVAILPAFAFSEPHFRLVPLLRAPTRAAPPAIGPPLFISHCAMLI